MATTPRRPGERPLSAAEKNAIFANLLQTVQDHGPSGWSHLSSSDLVVHVAKQLMHYHLRLVGLAEEPFAEAGNLSEEEFLDALELLASSFEAEFAEDAVTSINRSFRVAGAPYELRIVGDEPRVVVFGSKKLQKEVVEPTLALLDDPRFANPSVEFAKALDEWRKGRPADAMHSACNAMEGVARVLLEERHQKPGKNAWGAILPLLVRTGIIPPYLENSFGQFVASMRNQEGVGHGAGSSPPPPMTVAEAGLAVYQAGAAIVYMAARAPRAA